MGGYVWDDLVSGEEHCNLLGLGRYVLLAGEEMRLPPVPIWQYYNGRELKPREMHFKKSKILPQ